MTIAISAPEHGGDVQSVSVDYGIPASELLDFSANINPRGLPLQARQRLTRDASDAALLMRYPDPDARELRQALSKRLDVPIESIVIGEGAAALLSASVRAFQPMRCIIPIPAFSEYERACFAAGCGVEWFRLGSKDDFVHKMESRLGRRSSSVSDLLIVNNPHNPSGALTERQAMIRLLDAVEDAQANVLVDEAFIDYAPRAEITAEAARRPGVIAVRSLTKFYGCPALRVGYAVASPPMAARLAAQLPTWPVTTHALNALTEALADAEYAQTTLEENERERVKLEQALTNLGLYVFPSGANFLLFRIPERCCSSAEVRRRLIVQHRILIRNCDSFEGLEKSRYVRVTVRSGFDNNRLVAAIAERLGK